MRRALPQALVALAAVLSLVPPAAGRGRADVAALQVALRARGLYLATVDGIRGPGTGRAVRRFQRRAGLLVDGIAGPRTRRALGRLGGPRLGRRALRRGAVGGDVAALQFVLAWHGFPSGPFDGGFGPRLDRALRRFQAWAGLGADGVMGPATLGALRRRPPRCPLPLGRPTAGPVGDGFGPRGGAFHTGVDVAAPAGRLVVASRSGRVVSAGYDPGGYGYLVVLGHGRGVTTWYAHLSRILVSRGARVGFARPIGRVGSSGHATGPHLHLECRVGAAATDPIRALG